MNDPSEIRHPGADTSAYCSRTGETLFILTESRSIFKSNPKITQGNVVGLCREESEMDVDVEDCQQAPSHACLSRVAASNSVVKSFVAFALATLLASLLLSKPSC